MTGSIWPRCQQLLAVKIVDSTKTDGVFVPKITQMEYVFDELI